MTVIANLNEHKDQQQRKRRTTLEIRISLSVEDSLAQIMTAAKEGDIRAQMYMVDKFMALRI